ncbi:MAG: bifunctional hydroxymethylpyrimidine kinase/phosphomethylpyrimidine kinase [Actinomycetota bacterium]|nr:bifunctional hydroxymethylpyrimidine kinase/phosphomethylpyrimidine kinase [Actinomycetota bacterium]
MSGPREPPVPGGVAHVVSIAGTDPSGGAGIQADLKTFSALGAYGMAVVTALVAQTTTGVTAVEGVTPGFVTAQIDTLLGDVRVDAVKIGMLADAGVVTAVAAALRRWQPPHVVVDPVMVATSGDRLLDPDAVDALRNDLLPLADLITPNVAEAAVLAGGDPVKSLAAAEVQARDLANRLATRVLLKGGHLGGPTSVDVLVEDSAVRTFSAPRVETANTHGTGCTLSSAIAALRPRSATWAEAVDGAKAYLTAALAASELLQVGHGHGPVHHFWAWWPPESASAAYPGPSKHAVASPPPR